MRPKKVDEILLAQMRQRTPDDAARAAVRAASRSEHTEAAKIAEQGAQAALEKKGEDVRIIDLRGRGSYADFLLVVSGQSDRQLDAIAGEIEKTLKGLGQKVVGSEGHSGGRWILIDFGDLVVHVFHVEERGHYDLEGLWADAPQKRVHPTGSWYLNCYWRPRHHGLHHQLNAFVRAEEARGSRSCPACLAQNRRA